MTFWRTNIGSKIKNIKMYLVIKKKKSLEMLKVLGKLLYLFTKV